MPSEPINVSAGLIWHDGRFLASERPEGSPFAGYWELPGGKWQEEETGEAALRRELYEELGISVQACRFLCARKHVYEKQSLTVNLHFYIVLAYAGIAEAREGQRLAWLLPSEIASCNFLPADRELLAGIAKS